MRHQFRGCCLRSLFPSAEDVYSMIDDQSHLHQKRDRLKQLRAFCHAARFESISQAAKGIMSSQPAVSLQVRGLEEELGVRLFERRGPRIVLTWAGRSLYRYAMPLVVRMDRLPDIFAEEHFGVSLDLLRIGTGQTVASCLLPGYLRRFREQYPETPIEIRIGTGADRLKWLRAYELDLAVTTLDQNSPDTEFRPFAQSEVVLITPEDHPLAGRNEVTAEEISTYPIVCHTSRNYVGQAGKTVMRMHGIVPEATIEVDGWEAITSCVAAGAGISFVPDLCLTGHEPVWKISFKNAVPPWRYGVVTRRDGPIGLAAARFLRILTPDLSPNDAVGEKQEAPEEA